MRSGKRPFSFPLLFYDEEENGRFVFPGSHMIGARTEPAKTGCVVAEAMAASRAEIGTLVLHHPRIPLKFARRRASFCFCLMVSPSPTPLATARIRKFVNNCGQCKQFVYNSKQLSTKQAEVRL